MKIDFDGVQAFVTVAELGGFHKAAERLNISQTALTRRVQKLEAYLDLKLLDRTTRFVKLTSVGEDFLPQARSIVHDMSAAVTRLKDKSKYSTGNFTLSCVPTMAAYILPNLIRLYAEKFPNNRIRLVDATSYQVREAVLSNQAEVGISIHGEKHPNLVETQLFEDPLMFFCRKNHPLSKKKSVRWSDMSDANLIVVSNFVATRVFMDYQLAKRGISLTGAYEVQHHATAINLVAAGVGCSILPSSSCGENDRPGVIRIPLIEPIVKRKVVLIQRKGATLSPAAAAFCDVLKKVTVESLSKKKRLII
ncbi:LysR family transcriptional regulator [Limnohabitans sp.]|uniref:LysR family transcriptional regulator n=1 Tax=Limnohabitans sp. TaxID=1907725 RepID=UPI002FDE8C2B